MSIHAKSLLCRYSLVFCTALLSACSGVAWHQSSGIQESRMAAGTRVDELLAHVYTQIETGNLALAEQLLGEARQQYPANPYVALNLGVIYQRTGRLELAMTEYARVLRIEAESAKAGHPPRQVYWRTPLTDFVQTNIDALNKRPEERPRTGLAGQG